jgi:hypothetical protein
VYHPSVVAGELVYRVVAIGVNRVAGASTLTFAEKDATDIANAFSSSQGPASEDEVIALLGPEATRTAIQDALVALLVPRPTYLVVFFSGHGNRDGIAAADGIFPYSRLRSLLGAIRAQRTLVILDVCHAASFLVRDGRRAVIAGIRDESWMEALAGSSPGTRLFFSTGADRLSAENPAMQNGVFTAGLLAGMRRGFAGLQYGGSRFVSDLVAFKYACRHITHVQSQPQYPESRGLAAGDFPMLKSERHEWIGEGEILETIPTDRGLWVSAVLRDRMHVPTKISYEVLNSSLESVHSGEIQLSPREIETHVAGTIDFDYNILLNNQRVMIQWALGHRSIRHYWTLRLLDGAGGLMDEDITEAHYSL